MKFLHFTTEELQEIASLIAGSFFLAPPMSRRDDILKDVYEQIIIELRERRTADDNFQTKIN